MIKIIGTNHLMKKEEIEKILEEETPDIICIELCEARENAILSQIKYEDNNKTLLGMITNSIKNKAKKEGLDYGSDMKSALSYSIRNKVPYLLVDMPIMKTQELFLKIPKDEQEGFSKELLEFQNESITKKVNENEVIEGMKSRYPIAFEFLINMRNLYISNQILMARIKNPNKKIVVILGSSHAVNIKKMIGGIE